MSWAVVVRNIEDNGIPLILPHKSKIQAEKMLNISLKCPSKGSTYTCEFVTVEQIKESEDELSKYPKVTINVTVEYEDGSIKNL
jgi:hypothetical protein